MAQRGNINPTQIQLDLDGTLSANSDEHLPSQKAIKTYVDAAIAAAASGSCGCCGGGMGSGGGMGGGGIASYSFGVSWNLITRGGASFGW